MIKKKVQKRTFTIKKKKVNHPSSADATGL
jgi:hypothetical protein